MNQHLKLKCKYRQCHIISISFQYLNIQIEKSIFVMNGNIFTRPITNHYNLTCRVKKTQAAYLKLHKLYISFQYIF